MIDSVLHSAPAAASTSDLAEPLLKELMQAGHPAALPLFRTWAVDQLCQGRRTVPQLAEEYGLPASLIDCWLEKPLGRVSPAPGLNGKPGHADRPLLSVILPVYNEEENLPELYKQLTAVLTPLGSYELLFVNDGSRDNSLTLLRQLHEADPKVRVLSLSRNFGHQAAITAGLDHCRGQAAVLMDTDLQDPPELIAEMVHEWRQGAQVVYAVRTKRKENIFKRGAYFLFYRLLSALAEIDIPLDSGDFCLMDRTVVDLLNRLPERNRFLRGLRAWVGYRQVALPYERQARFQGAPKYTLRRLLRLAFDGLVSFSSLPLRLAGYVGMLTALLGVGYLAYILFARFFLPDVPAGWASVAALLLILGGPS